MEKKLLKLTILIININAEIREPTRILSKEDYREKVYYVHLKMTINL